MNKYPEVIVGAYVRDNKGKILLVKSHKWGGKNWSVCGGHVELGESIEEATQREVKEEIGIEVKDVMVFAVYDCIYPKQFFKKKHFVFLECNCKLKKVSNIKLDEDEIQEVRWFTIHEALKEKLEKFTRQSLNLLKNNPGNFYYKELNKK